MIVGYIMNTPNDLDKLLYGKQPLERIVSIEPGDESTEIFTEDKDGNITSQWVDNAYWILSHEPLSKESKLLKGQLHYRWGTKYTTRESYSKARAYNKQKEIYSIYNPKENFMTRTGYTYFKGMKHTEPSILSFDIETNGLKMDSDSRVYLISNTFRKNGVITRKLFCYDDYENEGEMIKAWCSWVRDINPSILCGHNIISYDLPFLQNIAELYDTCLCLGRDLSELKFDKYESKFRKDQSQFLFYKKVHCYGREIVDTYFLAVKVDITEKKYITYGLKYIVNVEGLEDKDRVFYDASKIRHNIDNPIERQKIKIYAEKDSDDALKLYDLFIPAFFYLTQHVPKSFQEIGCSATGSQINSFLIRSYLQVGHSIPKADEIQHFEGAISLGIPGIHKNVVSLDVQSLYPSLILQYSIYPKNKDPHGNFLKMVEYFTNERIKNKKLHKETKDDHYKDLSNTFKIFINSAYGLLGANGLNFNSAFDANKVTRLGRETLKKGIEHITGIPFDDWKTQNFKEDLEEKEEPELL